MNIEDNVEGKGEEGKQNLSCYKHLFRAENNTSYHD